ncbi:hypothetical protein J2W33_001741 [Variovorax boronicumulans]|nr:hypothetical protein [Variovorax boronicumulans]
MPTPSSNTIEALTLTRSNLKGVGEFRS